ncbi:hypothetical protein IFM89_028579 [Coptis chinensis]|uniref:Uncharacterized protein n=1 Tax=Coptis chinensis TaxID=261450 RepID=A0A835IGF7_9MAGN|nr:hypothetical protein IFM89_028579 [Coptis chinensis]
MTMARSKSQLLNKEDVQEEYFTTKNEDLSTTEEDDSDDDPTFDILEKTRSSLSKLSLKKSQSQSRTSKFNDSANNKRKLDFEEVKTPELDEVDKKSFENVEKMIKVDQCKVYLRKHGLRLTGNKNVLIERIREHPGIVNGEGEQKYPALSFVLNCKGDACTGDVVMFEQNVYEMYNIASRSASGPPCGTRIVAGRIVKESYGAAKQQHTFTIEVLWSKGEKPIPPFHPLLIKGRNLYRLKTMRQKWTDELERSKVLLEKHSRGSFARSSRETRVQEKELKKIRKEQRFVRNTCITMHKENQHPHPIPLKPNSSQEQPVISQRQQKPVESTMQPNRILTGIKQQPSFMPQPSQIKPKPAESIMQPKRILTEISQQPKFMPQPSQIKPKPVESIMQPKRILTEISQQPKFMPQPSQIKPQMNSLVQKTYAPENIVKIQNTDVSWKWWGNINEVEKQANTVKDHQSYAQSWPSHVQAYPSGPVNKQALTNLNSPPRSPSRHPMQEQHCRFYARGWCYNGDNCKFLHEYRREQSFNSPPRSPLHLNHGKFNQCHNPNGYVRKQSSTSLNMPPRSPKRQQHCWQYAVGGRCSYGDNSQIPAYGCYDAYELSIL